MRVRADRTLRRGVDRNVDLKRAVEASPEMGLGLANEFRGAFRKDRRGNDRSAEPLDELGKAKADAPTLQAYAVEGESLCAGGYRAFDEPVPEPTARKVLPVRPRLGESRADGFREGSDPGLRRCKDKIDGDGFALGPPRNIVRDRIDELEPAGHRLNREEPLCVDTGRIGRIQIVPLIGEGVGFAKD